MRTSDFYYELPKELIAQHPLENRTASRLMIADRDTEDIRHGSFTDIIDELEQGDVMVMNDSRVIPARLFGNRPGREEKIETLLLKRIEGNMWECLVRPGKKMKPGGRIVYGDGILNGVVRKLGEDGTRLIEFHFHGIFEEILDKLGEMPLPPYITERLEDSERYQTVYSKNNGSAAAPTAGLHFDKDLMNKIEEKGIKLVYITLHVGLGTFRPVKVDDINEHIMHAEYYDISVEAAAAINQARSNGSKVISVGTTTTRTLETVSDVNGKISASKGWTDIFIYPGYKFKSVDALITNFHLPESTLLMLVSAFGTKEFMLKAYSEAIKEKYRFFSFGDAMFIK